MKRTVGDILKVDLGDGTHSYAHVSTDPLVIFYDCKTSRDLPLSEIGKLPVAFKVWVHNQDIKRGIWEKVGNLPLAPDNLEQPYMFKQDRITGRLAIHHSDFEDTNYERPATLEECRGLERAAVWDASHVEDRLRDYYEGVENKWVKSLAIEDQKVPVDQKQAEWVSS
jgi:hypothetical protein